MIIKAVQYIAWGMLVGIDKLANVILLGSIHKTISMRVSFAVHCKWVRPRYSWVKPFGKLIDWLFVYAGDPDHIWKNYEIHEINNRAFWPWFVIVDEVSFEDASKKMQDFTFHGRVREQ